VLEFDFQKQAQKYYQLSPAIILGSGASAAHGLPGMGKLATHLIDTVDESEFTKEEQVAWKQFKEELTSGKDLEEALHDVRVSDSLTRQIVSATWQLLSKEDIAVFQKSLSSPGFFPLSKLIKSLFRSANKQVDIITTNYDRMAEYAVEQAGIHHYTGFSYGYHRTQSDKESLKAQRVVNILKVHGSLDWFKSPSGAVIGLGQMNNIPEEHTPQIVTPGIEKYLNTYHDPFRTVIQLADASIGSNTSYLCVGFGFNDIHIQEKLINKCCHDDACITVITRELSNSAKRFLLSGEAQNYLAIERGKNDSESIIYSSHSETPMTVDEDHWSLEGYLKLVI